MIVSHALLIHKFFLVEIATRVAYFAITIFMVE